jgi:hypothetical protein
MKLVMACFWFALGIGILVSQAQAGREDSPIRVFSSGAGWLAVFFGLFNLGRWGLEWAARAQNRQADAAQQEQTRRRNLEARRDRPSEEAQPNPDFDFTKPP